MGGGESRGAGKRRVWCRPPSRRQSTVGHEERLVGTGRRAALPRSSVREDRASTVPVYRPRRPRASAAPQQRLALASARFLTAVRVANR